MATSKAAVDIELKANVQQLISALSKVEDISAKQAKALVRDVEKSNAAMERASKKAARAQSRAIDNAAKEAKARAEGMTDVMQKTATEVASIFGVGILGDLEGTFDIGRQATEKFGGSVQASMAIGSAAVVAFAAAGVQALQFLTERQTALAEEIAGSADQIRNFASAATVAKVDEFAFQMEALAAGVLAAKAEMGLANDELLDMADHTAAMEVFGLPKWMGWVTEKNVDLLKSLPENLQGIVLILDQLVGGPFSLQDALMTEAIGKDLRQRGEEIGQITKKNEDFISSIKEMADEEKKAERAADIQAKADATDAQARARRRLAEASRISAEIQAEINEETAREEGAQKEALKALQAADQIRSKSVTTQLDDRGKLNESLDRQMATIQKSIDLNGENAVSTEAMVQALAAYNFQLDVLEQKETAQKLAETTAAVNLAADSINQLAFAASTFAGLALDRFSELADAERERFEILQEHRIEAKSKEIAALVESGEITQEQADMKLSLMERNEQARADNHKNLNKDQRKAANRAFAVSQAAATAGVLAAGAQAYMNMLIAFSYMQFGAPAAAAAITVPAVAAQLAVIASNKPPQFADGGLVTPDHRLISAQPGEAVVSRRGVAALGGPSGLSELNKGMGSGGSMTANIVIDRRIIGQAVADIVPSSMTRRSGRIAVYGG